MHGRIFTLMSWVILMTTLVTSCTSGGGGGGASQGSSTQPVVDASGKKTYTVDPATGATLSAAGISSSDPSFANAGVVIPPGSLSIPVNISIFQAQSLVGSSTASAVGSSNLTAAGPAVAVLPSQAVSITNPLAISIPFSLLTSLTGNKQVVVIAIYPGESKNELETFVGDELDLGTSGVVKLSITRFGAFQVVYSDNEVAKQKVETEIKIEQKTAADTDKPPVLTTSTITITSHTTSQTVANGSATFSITATVTPAAVLSYQWQKQESGIGPFVNIMGATDSSLMLSSLSYNANNGDMYRVIVSATGGAASVTSNPFTLTVPYSEYMQDGGYVSPPSGSGDSTNFQPTFTLTGPPTISGTTCEEFKITATNGALAIPVSFSLSWVFSADYFGGAFYSAEDCNSVSMLTPQSTQSITIASGETIKSFYFKPDWTNGVLTNGVISISVQNIMNNQMLNSIDVTVNPEAETAH